MTIKDLKTGDILLINNPFKITKPLYYLSAAIRFISGCNYNHAAIILEEDGEKYVVEAVYPKVIKTRLEDWIYITDRTILVQRPLCNVKDRKVIAGRIKRQIGKQYDVSSLFIHLPLMIISEKLGFEKYTGKTQLEAIKKVYCYEMCANIYREFFNEWWKVTPEEQYSNHFFFRRKLKI